MLNDKRGVIGRSLSSVPQNYREAAFIAGQLGKCTCHSVTNGNTYWHIAYTMFTELPVFVLYESSLWSGVFLIIIFSVSVWNGGGFYIEVFGRKCVLIISHPFSS